jgi:hypothetical protein
MWEGVRERGKVVDAVEHGEAADWYYFSLQPLACTVDKEFGRREQP